MTALFIPNHPNRIRRGCMLARSAYQAIFLCLTLFYVQISWTVGNDVWKVHLVAPTLPLAANFSQFVPPDKESTSQLRYDWTNLQVNSKLGHMIKRHQSDCSLPPGRFWFRNRFGLGSDLHVWSQALCNSMELKVRIKTLREWLWRDLELCGEVNSTLNHLSTLECYFPESEPTCPGDRDDIVLHQGDDSSAVHLARGRGRVGMECEHIIRDYGLPGFRAAAIEFLFSRVSPSVVAEANHQIRQIFPGGTVPSQLITVHIRWGDKADEMELVPIHEYINAVESILSERAEPAGKVNIFLATEDPSAVNAFQQSAPKQWNVYTDFYFTEMLPNRVAAYNGAPQMATALHGRPGLVALASLLVSCEAYDFVLTTTSNWSRLMNELRKTVIESRCRGCTAVRDLRPGEW